MTEFYFENPFLASWFNSGAVLLGFVVSLLFTLLVVSKSKLEGSGLVVSAVMVLGTLAGLPLTMGRIGFYITVADLEAVAYLSIVGTSAAVMVGAYSLITKRFVRRNYEESVMSPRDNVTPIEGMSPRSSENDKTVVARGNSESARGASENPSAWLKGMSGSMAGQTFPLSSDSVAIGRAANNDLVIDDRAVSRNHSVVSFRNGEYFIEDAGSKTGTIVEGITSTKSRLMPGTRLKLGNTEFVFMQDESMSTIKKTRNNIRASLGAQSNKPAETIVMKQEAGTLSWLAFTGGPQKGQSYQLKVGNNAIGRDPGNDCVVEDKKAGRRHAMIHIAGNVITLLDVGSQTGTYVGSKQIKGYSLHSGGSIGIGNTKLRLMSVEEAERMSDTMSGVTYLGVPGGGRSDVLIVESGTDAGKSFQLTSGDNLIGRETDCAIQLSDGSVSRHHAKVRCVDGKFTAFDMGSHTGTHVDGELVRGYNLTSGEVISIGDTKLVLMQAES